MKTIIERRKLPTVAERMEIRVGIMVGLENCLARMLGMDPAGGDDYRLAVMSSHVGFLASLVGLHGDGADLRPKLKDCAAYAMGWAEQLTGERVDRLVIAERVRQMQLLKDGEIAFDCASPVVDPLRKCRVLIEELGEVAKAVDLLEELLMLTKRKHDLIAEVIQVAAVCVAWLEAISMAATGDKRRGAEDAKALNGKGRA